MPVSELVTFPPVTVTSLTSVACLGLHVLSYLRATFKWQLDGSVKATFEAFGLPALDYLTSSDSWREAFSKVS